MRATFSSERRSTCSGRSISAARVAASLAPVASSASRSTPGSTGRSWAERQAEVERQRQLGQAVRGALGVAGRLDLVGGVGELEGDAAGHLLGDPQVVALEEDQPDHELQHHDRHE